MIVSRPSQRSALWLTILWFRTSSWATIAGTILLTCRRALWWRRGLGTAECLRRSGMRRLVGVLTVALAIAAVPSFASAQTAAAKTMNAQGTVSAVAPDS